jgi:hypothetical protein
MQGTNDPLPVRVTQWKLKLIKNLFENGFALEVIADQVDLDVHLVKRIAVILSGTKEEHLSGGRE